MKKSGATLIVFLVIGLLAGVILSELLAPVKGISFLTHAAEIYWHPKADLQLLKYDLDITIRLNLLSIACLAAAIWIYRKV
jgi:hypothetical protein